MLQFVFGSVLLGGLTCVGIHSSCVGCSCVFTCVLACVGVTYICVGMLIHCKYIVNSATFS